MATPFSETFELELIDVLNTLTITLKITVNPTPPPAAPQNSAPTFDSDPSENPFSVKTWWQQFNDLKTLQTLA